MKINLIDGNNFLRRQFESEGPTVVTQLFVQACSVPANETLIWVWDGKHAKSARQKIMPTYKVKQDEPESVDSFHVFMNTFKTLIGLSKSIQVELEGFEGDDLIAAICRSKSPETTIRIESNDQDFRQLLIDDTIELGYMAPKLEGFKQDDIRLYKTLVGDKADNILGLKGFGHGTFEKLSDAQKCNFEDFILGNLELTETEAKEKLGLTPAKAKNLFSQREDLLTYWQVIDFIPISSEQLSKGMTVPNFNPQVAQEILNAIQLENPMVM